MRSVSTGTPARASATRSVVVGSDLSEASDRLIREASRLARHSGSALHVISAYPPPAARFGSQTEESLPEAVMTEVRQALPAQLRRVLPLENRVESQEVRFGSPAAVILDRAAEIDADVIILGPHRGRDVHAHFLGTTADEVLRHATTPCLAMRGPLTLPIRRIGVASDFSAVGEAAFARAFDWAARFGARAGRSGEHPVSVCAVHVLDPADRARAAERRARLADVVERAAERKPDSGARTSCEVLADPDVSGALVRWADRACLDLFVIGTHGKSGWQRGNLGSISSALARRAPCPVLLVPAPR